MNSFCVFAGDEHVELVTQIVDRYTTVTSNTGKDLTETQRTIRLTRRHLQARRFEPIAAPFSDFDEESALLVDGGRRAKLVQSSFTNYNWIILISVERERKGSKRETYTG